MNVASLLVGNEIVVDLRSGIQQRIFEIVESLLLLRLGALEARDVGAAREERGGKLTGQLITKVKNNMRNSLLSVSDKIMLRKRALVESVNDELKNIAQIEHSRHRSFANFITNALSAIAAYCFFPKKPSISLEFVSDNQLTLF